MSEDFARCLKKVKFEKQLKKLGNKLKNKKSVIYGAGKFFVYIKEHFGLENLDIIGICDKSFDEYDTDFCGYKKIPAGEIADSGADCVIVATYKYLDIMYDLQRRLPGLKVIPLVDRPFFELLKEIWSEKQ